LSRGNPTSVLGSGKQKRKREANRKFCSQKEHTRWVRRDRQESKKKSFIKLERIGVKEA